VSICDVKGVGCSYMVLATVFSRPQLNAVLGKMEKALTETWHREFTSTDGRSAWEALDMGDVLVHVMSEEARHYYNLEGLYGAGVLVDLPFLSDEERKRRDVWSTTL
jgi:ribosome silencing factor RsfS/YbeB/iojap